MDIWRFEERSQLIYYQEPLEDAPGGRVPHGAADPRVVNVLREGL